MSDCRCQFLYFKTPELAKAPISFLDDAFPEQILGKIFRYVPHTLLENVSKVSTRWAKIVDRYTGRMLIVKNGNSFLADYDSSFDKLSIKSNFWISLARDSQTKYEEGSEQSSKDSNIAVNEPIITGNPESLRKVGFVGMLEHKFMESILSQCKNVTGLYLHFSVFTKMLDDFTEGDCCNLSRLTPKLKELVIDSCGTTAEEVGDSEKVFNFKHAFCSTYKFLLMQQFPFLEKFILIVPYFMSWEGQLIFAMACFLGRHSKTLKSFSFHQKYEIAEDYNENSQDQENHTESPKDETDIDIIKDIISDLKKRELGKGDCPEKSILNNGPNNNFSPKSGVNYLSLKQLAVSARELKKLSLEEFHIILVRPQESSPIWMNFLIEQTRFKKLIFVGDKIPCPYKSIEVNAPTLVTVRLDVRDLVNLECFKNCNNLKHLTLRGKDDLKIDTSDDDEDNNESNNEKHTLYTPPVQLKNAKSLPHSLECVEINNLRTDRDDVTFLALILPHLRDLTLLNVGWEGKLGLRLSHLLLVWQQHRLDHFCIKSSINMMSYSELEGDMSYPINLLGCVIQSNSFTAASQFSLEVWKNEKGSYTICSSNSNLSLDDDDFDVFCIPNKSKILLENEEEEESESEYDSESSNEDDDDRSSTAENEGSGEDDEWEDAENSCDE